MTVSEAKRWKESPDPSVRAEAARVLKAKAARSSRVRARPGVRAPVKTKAERSAEADRREVEGKEAAKKRASDNLGPRCEVVSVVAGQEVRCPAFATDADHVLGGRMKVDMEALGAEGFMAMCRMHHDMKTASTPTRAVWLRQAEDHAIRHGYRRLLGFVCRARAKYEGKRSVGVRVETEPEALAATTTKEGTNHG